MKKLSVFAVAAFVTMFAVSNSYAWVGAGLHWGYDLSMSMDDVSKEKINLGSFKIADLEVGSEALYVSRLQWRNSPLNFGGKVYLDFIPVINAIELSCNFGLWQYDGALHVLNPQKTLGNVTLDNPIPELVHDEIPLTLKNTGLSYVGLSGTPYAKLHFDASVRKQILDLWLIKFNGGAGVSAHFATPLLSNALVEKALDIKISDDASAALANLSDPDLAKGAAKKIVQEIIDQALGKPVIGGHIVLGVQAKLPVIPVGVYVDGKYMFPFSKFDSDASGVKGFGSGLLFNMGISLSL
ncbi:MAG: hypothetical protein FWB85_00160 [Chitinispirillia bacterium]|nr:hypothetical protein [Chitinispirillia bacterium]MCL2240922.1 hypothetical protein [Chitinispirillia bacterium]